MASGFIQFSSVQSLSRVQLFANPWTTACEASLSITNSQSLPKLMSIESMMPSNHLTCLLRNLHAGQEATARTLYGTSNWLKTEKGIWQGVILSPCLFNLYTEHIMRNAGLDELQAGSKTSRRNNSLRYVDNTPLMADSEEELKNFLIRVRGEWKNRHKTKY